MITLELSFLLLTGVFCVTLAVGSIDRDSLLNEAIGEFATYPHSTNDGSPNTSAKLLSAVKRATRTAIKEGNARLKLETVIKKAERKILESQEQLSGNVGEARAEALAKELLHTPGSVLKSDEVAKVYESTDCIEIVSGKPDCLLLGTRFRTVSGVCNNLRNPVFGAAETPFRRLIASQYEDGISQLRGTMQGRGTTLLTQGPFSPPNPSARLVSLSVVNDRQVIDKRFTHLLMQWGQFIDHDLDLAPVFSEPCEGCTDNDRCVPIQVPRNDRNGEIAKLCHTFSRSIPACDRPPLGELKPREQLNQLNSFLDASQIYGTNNAVFSALRDPQSGRLRTGPNIPANKGPSLPVDTDSKVECMGGQKCFLAGDIRVNEHVALIAMHTIWMREHNRIADRLSELNPHWDKEMVFQVARLIVGAEIQKITYKDYLPIIMGSGYTLISPYDKYDDNINPGIPNAFAAAAFRFGHSQIQPFFDRLNENYEPADIGPLSLLDSFFNPSQYTESKGTDPILRGLLTEAPRKVDEFLNAVLTNHLFQTNSTAGMDLASLNIQRGRDHGLPPYLTWKRWAQKQCGISSDISNELTAIHFLQTYGSLETVDLWVGGLAEEKLPGGVIGATFACIFAKTFEAIRNGDRFYYENANDTVGTLTPQQRSTIENTSLSRIICDNADNITTIQPNAFLADENRVPCSSLPDIDLTAWRAECYARIRINRQMNPISISALSTPTMSLMTSGSSSTIPMGERSTCLSFQCPSSNEEVTLGVFPTSLMDRSRCRVKPNSRLPVNNAFSRATYTGRISQSDITPSAGLYSDIDSCISGSSKAFRFWCRGDEVITQDETLRELENELDEEDAFHSDSLPKRPQIQQLPPRKFDIPKDYQHMLTKITPPEKIQSTTNERLIKLLENVLETLKYAQAENKGRQYPHNNEQILSTKEQSTEPASNTTQLIDHLSKALEQFNV